MNYHNIKNFFIVITGPTGVGKTDFSLALAEKISGEIINGDMGQFYAPVSIGTAKPSWQNEKIPHHLFDILHTVEDAQKFSVENYRSMVEAQLRDIWERHKIPIVVGGSGFYIKSLFFPPLKQQPQENFASVEIEKIDWDTLHAIDPARAQQIHPRDKYRIERALAIWRATGARPSLYKPQFAPLGKALVIHCTRERSELLNRINYRADEMLKAGWLEEVSSLSQQWKQFFLQKKLIGYPEIIAYQKGDISYTLLREMLKKNTRAYAKRQGTFWSSLQAALSQEKVMCKELNLTLLPLDLYINQLLKDVYELF